MDLPARAADAETGSAFLRRTDELGRSALDDQIEAAILSGNVPNYLRQLVPITIQADGREALLFVSNDYLAIGSDDDFVRIPMTSAAAQRIANRLGATLPTPKLVDEIYRQAEVKLPPSWIDGGPTPGSLKDYALHNKTLEERRVKGGYPLGPLTAGHKKDIVLCQVIAEKPTRVAIYGWHKREGEVIQPVSTSHSCRYADYSHGVRLIDQMMWIDGKAHRVSDVLRDPERASIISNEGAIPIVEYDTVLVPYR